MTTETSPNGWPLIPDTSPRPTRTWTIPGTGRHLVLAPGAAGFVLVHFALWFHEEVERLDLGVWDEWGWAYRPQRGTTSVWSNHASATAADLNATRHPIGVDTLQTFTAPQVARIRRRITRRYRGLINWGGEWRRPDAMHYELAGTPEAIRRLAARLAKTPRGKRILASNPGALR